MILLHVLHADGTLGWPEHAPYDRIIVTAAPDDVPAALTWVQAVPGVRHALVIIGETLGAWGQYELVPL